jgi:hypothetical protein
LSAAGRWSRSPSGVATVRKIYALAKAGHGLAGIVKRLTADGDRPFGDREVYTDREGRTRRRMKAGERFGSGKWVRSNVGNILRDRRAVGEYQPYKRRGANGKREPDSPPVPGFFPAAVTESDWLAARAGSEQRRWLRSEAGAYVNLFAGLLVNAWDGESYYCDTRTSKGGRKDRFLRNMSALEVRPTRHPGRHDRRGRHPVLWERDHERPAGRGAPGLREDLPRPDGAEAIGGGEPPGQRAGRGGPPQRRVPGDARARFAEPPRADHERARDRAPQPLGQPGRPEGPQHGRATGAAHDPPDRRPTGRDPHHPRHGAAPPQAGGPGRRPPGRPTR